MKRAIVIALVVAGLSASSAANAADLDPDPTGEAAETDETDALAGAFVVGGRARPFAPAYESWFGADRYTPHYLRAAVETVGLMAIGFTYYIVDPLANREDFDHPTFEDRITFRSFRFDTNLNTTNHLLHPLAGGLVYGMARVNGLSIPAAFGYGLVQTLIWELALEWREKQSINDIIYTSFGAVPIGEFGFQLGEYLNSGGLRAGVAQEAAAWTLGLPRRLHRLLDGDAPAMELPKDRLGLSSAFGHDFALAYEAGALSNDEGGVGTLNTARIDASVVAMPGFLRPGRFETPFMTGNFSELHLRLGVSDPGIVESDLQVRATLLGHYEQAFRADDDGDLEGHATMLGFGPAMRFQASKLLGRDDQLSTVHLPGPHAEVWIRDGDLSARFGGEAYVDFGSIESLAYPKFIGLYGSEGTKSVLQKRSYAYSLGTWARVRGAIALGPFSVSGSLGYGNYGSIEGLDRFQEEVTRDIHGTEEVLELEAAASLRLVSILTAGIGIRERWRESTLGSVQERRWDRNLHLSLGLSF